MKFNIIAKVKIKYISSIIDDLFKKSISFKTHYDGDEFEYNKDDKLIGYRLFWTNISDKKALKMINILKSNKKIINVKKSKVL